MNEHVRELRALGYIVIAPDEIDAVDDELEASVEAAQRNAADPRPLVRTARPVTREDFELALDVFLAIATEPADHPTFYRGPS